MLPQRLARVAVAVTTAALVVPTGPAQAAPKAPDLPRLPAVAKIYPHVAGGEREVHADYVTIEGRTCGASTVEEDVAGMIAEYSAAEPAAPTRSTPMVILRAMRFAEVKRAKLFTTRLERFYRRCGREYGETRNVRIPVDLGQSSWGRSLSLRSGNGREHGNVVAARTGKRVVVAMTISEGARPPAPRKTVRLADLAFRVATR